MPVAVTRAPRTTRGYACAARSAATSGAWTTRDPLNDSGAREPLVQTHVALGHSEPDPQPQDEHESGHGYVVVADEARADRARQLEHRPREDREKLVDEVVVALAAREHVEQSLPEHEAAGDLDQCTRDHDDHELDRHHGAWRGATAPSRSGVSRTSLRVMS